MRAYSSSVAAHALGVERRWLDTVVIQHDIEGVRRQRQGVSRAISPAAVLKIAIALELMHTLQVPVGAALGLATALLEGAGEHSPGDGLSIRLDIEAVKHRVAAGLADAVESHPPPRRGRPPLTR